MCRDEIFSQTVVGVLREENYQIYLWNGSTFDNYSELPNGCSLKCDFVALRWGRGCQGSPVSAV